jgi:drug/metabolite transporter (DMT)-like permease
MLGGLLALLSAMAFSMNSVLVRRGVVTATPSQAAFVTVLIGVPMFLLAALITGQIFRATDLPGSSYAFLAAGGVVNFVAGRHFNYQAIEAMGAARAAPFQALTLPYSVLIAFLFLDESVTLYVGFGVALIMIGPVMMVERRVPRPVAAVVVAENPDAAVATIEAEATMTPAQIEPRVELRQVEGYVAAILASVAYGTSPILFRAALEGESGLSIFSGFVSYAAAGLVLIASLLLPGRMALLSTLQPASVRMFFGASFFVFLAQVLRFVALSLAPVAIVTGLERTNSVFTLILSWYLNRRLEFITLRVVLGILTSVTGALILVAVLA